MHSKITDFPAFYAAGDNPSTECQMDARNTVFSIPSFFSLTWSVVVALSAFYLCMRVWVRCSHHTWECNFMRSDQKSHCRKKPSSPHRLAIEYSPRVRTIHHHPCARKMDVITRSKSQAKKQPLMHPGEQKARKKPTAKRCVRFADDAKSWDGKRPEHILIENIVLEFWKSTPQFTTVHKLVDDKNAAVLLVLHRFLVVAVERVKRDVRGAGVALITSGRGGQHHVLLRKEHIPHLQRLTQHVHAAHNMTAAW